MGTGSETETRLTGCVLFDHEPPIVRRWGSSMYLIPWGSSWPALLFQNKAEERGPFVSVMQSLASDGTTAKGEEDEWG